ncbi:hypothetical protein LIER_32256 [Lithospermum erythrorhizon]|uniref:Gag-pol polyprotein n=1 Tax=Lithospermum erythrorhizon TaxID=34254 RepID=A0AAV3RTD6_LITER
MEANREGRAIMRPPLLDGKNDPYWKARMTAFLKFVDTKTRKAVLTGWNPPTQATVEGGGRVVKEKKDWTLAEDELALGNSKALNSIFNVVDPSVFKLIRKFIVAKEAWDILQITYEGTAKIRMLRLQQLTTKWETTTMEEDETITSYSTRINDMANEAFALGEPMTNEKQVRNVLRSLPRRFESKITTIEEA